MRSAAALLAAALAQLPAAAAAQPAEPSEAALASGTAARSSYETTWGRCYGEALDGFLLTAADSPGGSKRVPLHVPVENLWFVNVKGAPTLQLDSDCLDEPVQVTLLTASVTLGDFRPEVGALMEELGIRIELVRVLATSEDFLSDLNSRRIELATREGQLRPDGFQWRPSSSKYPLEGIYVFPDDYRSPTGATIVTSCLPTCHIGYKLSELVHVTYRVDRTIDGNSAPVTREWIEIDQAVRATVRSWTMHP